MIANIADCLHNSLILQAISLKKSDEIARPIARTKNKIQRILNSTPSFFPKAPLRYEYKILVFKNFVSNNAQVDQS